MSVTYSTAVKNARLDAVIAQIGTTGTIEIGTTGMGSVLATFILNSTAGTSGSGVLTFSGMPKSATASAGTAAAARIRTGGTTDIVTGLTVGTSGADINLNSVTFSAGQTVTLTSATITSP